MIVSMPNASDDEAQQGRMRSKCESNDARPVVLDIRNLNVEFNSAGGIVHAVRGISLNVRAREVLAVVGESGSGKSVTAVSTLGLLPSNARISGEIYIDGVEVVNSNADVLRDVRRHRVGIVFQDPIGSLDPVHTIGFQIVEFLRIRQPGLSKRAARKRAVELLAAVGMPDPEGRLNFYPHQMSGGQCQRAMIAMALAGEPDLLIADEPTTALDVTVQAEVLNVLRHVRERFATAILLITHDMGVVADLADRVVVMRSGEIVESGGVEGLFDEPRAEYTRTLLAAVPKLHDVMRRKPGERAGIGDESRLPIQDRKIAALEIKNLYMSYGSRGRNQVKAVSDVSLRLEIGDMVGLVGESGSGKTTVGRCASGLLSPTSGAVQMLGVDLGRGSNRVVRDVRKKLGVVFQSPTASLDPKFTVGETIQEPLRVLGGMSGTGVARRVGELLESVGLSATWAGRYPHELSGGQLQRVAIARAIALRPQLVIADEPTSALDVSVQAQVLRTFQDLQTELRFACLFISHNLAVIDQLCDRVVVMRQGRVVEEGMTDSVLRSPIAEYTRDLIAAMPLPDPRAQRARPDRRKAIVEGDAS